MCIFCKIANHEIPSNVVAEGDDWIAFHDLNPQAPTHVLVIPKQHIVALPEAGSDHAALLGNLMLAVNEVARATGLVEDGFRTVINSGSHGGQTVFHLHIHVLGGRPMIWPPG